MLCHRVKYEEMIWVHCPFVSVDRVDLVSWFTEDIWLVRTLLPVVCDVRKVVKTLKRCLCRWLVADPKGWLWLAWQVIVEACHASEHYCFYLCSWYILLWILMPTRWHFAFAGDVQFSVRVIVRRDNLQIHACIHVRNILSYAFLCRFMIVFIYLILDTHSNSMLINPSFVVLLEEGC